MSDIYLSVIIPAYNESIRLSRTLPRVVEYLKKQSYPSEVILIDDGSQDETRQTAENYLQDIQHQVLVNPGNQGKGYSVKRGMLEAKGEYLLFSDADLSTPIEEVERFIQRLKSGYDVIVGSRGLPESNVEVTQNILRQSMGRIFNLLARLFSFNKIKDSQCGFKCFKRDVARDLFQRQIFKGFSFDAEIIYMAQKLGYRILEEPVIWRNSPNSKVHMIGDSCCMMGDIMRIRWIHRHLK